MTGQCSIMSGGEGVDDDDLGSERQSSLACSRLKQGWRN